MKTFAVIPAGGKGVRSGLSAPKQFIKFKGKELIAYTLQVFQRNDLIDEIVVACDPAYYNLLFDIKIRYKLSKLTKIVEGGKERQDSVFNGLAAINASGSDLVAVHDAARPLLPNSLLTDAILMAKEKGNAVVCLNARDTLVKGKKTVSSYVNRDEFYYVQTPQIFKYKDLMNAMESAAADNFTGTDESMLVKRTGKRVYIAEGSTLNFKVTTPDDIVMFENLIEAGITH